MKGALSRQATRQLAQIGAYLSRRSPTGADSVRAAIRASMKTLATFPAAGTAQHISKVRKLIEPRYRYRLYYVVGLGAITIISFRHPAEDKDAVE